MLVGFRFTIVKDIPVADVEDGLPAPLTMILMPLTYDITVGTGAGSISWSSSRSSAASWARSTATRLVTAAFAIYFAQDWINMLIAAK